ncbi:hypothetical protein L083_1430 [Actinoplanes sp. N902-109]|nr:hypothetical protein L083_1430 [Actinoplanes sp. N902-109]
MASGTLYARQRATATGWIPELPDARIDGRDVGPKRAMT